MMSVDLHRQRDCVRLRQNEEKSVITMVVT